MSFFFLIRRLARSVVPFAQICAFVLLVSTMLGLRAWGDDLNVVLFEFLESCTDWLHVQHWYTGPGALDARDALGADRCRR